MECGFYHSSRGYWQTTEYPSAKYLADYPVGTVEVSLKPCEFHEYREGEWVYHGPPETTLEERRARLHPLTARQLRLGLLDANRTFAQVDAAIAAIEDDIAQEKALVEWEYAATFNRTHPLVVSLSAALGFTSEEVDTLWEDALAL